MALDAYIAEEDEGAALGLAGLEEGGEALGDVGFLGCEVHVAHVGDRLGAVGDDDDVGESAFRRADCPGSFVFCLREFDTAETLDSATAAAATIGCR